MNKKTSSSTTKKNSTSLQNKFHELWYDQKKAYFKDEYGTIHGTTWFFDTRFTKSLVDYKSFTSWWKLIDICIATDWTSTEGWGCSSDSTSNSVIVHIDNKVIHEWKTFYSNKKTSEYNRFTEIIDCSYDADKKKVTVMVKDGTWHTQTFEFPYSSFKNRTINNRLLDSLWLPPELLVNEVKVETASELHNTLVDEKQATFDMIITGWRYLEGTTKWMRDDAKKSLLNPLFTDTYDINTIPEDIVQIYANLVNTKDFLSLVSKISSQHVKTTLCTKQMEKYDLNTQWDCARGEEVTKICALWELDIHAITLEKFLAKDWWYYIYSALDIIKNNNLDIDIVVPHIRNCLKKHHIPSWRNYSEEKKIQGIEKVFSLIAEWEQKTVPILKQELAQEIIKDETWLAFSPSTAIKHLDLTEEYKLDSSNYQAIIHSLANIDMFPLLKHDRERTTKLIKRIAQCALTYNIKLPSNVISMMIYLEKEWDKEWKKDLSFIKLQLSYYPDNTIVADLVKNNPNNTLQFYIDLWLTDIEAITSYITKYTFVRQRDTIEYNMDECIKTLQDNKLFTPEMQNIFTTFIDRLFTNPNLTNASDLFYGHYFTYLKYANFATQGAFDIRTKNITQHSINPDNRDNRMYYIIKWISYRWASSKQIEDFIETFKDKKDIYNTLLKDSITYVDKKFIHTIIQNLYTTWTKEALEQAKRISSDCNFDPIWWKKIDLARLTKEYCDIYDGKRVIEKYELSDSYKQHIIKKFFKDDNLDQAMLYALENKIIITPELYNTYLEYNQKRKEEIAKREEERVEKEKQDALERNKKVLLFQEHIVENRYKTIIEYKNPQKYIFLETPEHELVIASKPLEYHRDILVSIGGKKENMIWWGWMEIDETNKTIILSWSSGDFGKIYNEYYDIVVTIIKKSYPDYIVEFNNERH